MIIYILYLGNGTHFQTHILLGKKGMFHFSFLTHPLNYAQHSRLHSPLCFYQDPRFNSTIDMRTGYKTTLILSMPICNYEGDVIGVAQIINKRNDSNEFTDRDVEVFQR